MVFNTCKQIICYSPNYMYNIRFRLKMSISIKIFAINLHL